MVKRHRFPLVVVVSCLLLGGTTAAPFAAAQQPRPEVLIEPALAAAMPGWAIPKLGPDGAQWSEGRSTDGRIQVLVEAGAGEKGIAGRKTTKFAIVPLNGDKPTGIPQIITLDGVFGYDAISNDGSTLFVTEILTGAKKGGYYVRMVKTATGVLDPNILKDAPIDSEAAVDRDPEVMYGTSIARLRLPKFRNWIFTLYDGDGHHPFIHALNTKGYALCLDLPPHGKSVKDLELSWKLTGNRNQITVANTKLNKSWKLIVNARNVSFA